MAYRYTRDRLVPGAYHVFNRASRGRRMFRDDEDRRTFEWMMNRYLATATSKDLRGRGFANLRDEVRLVARNLLTTHFHLIVWQRVPGGLDNLMQRVGTSYTRYYNQKYGESGPLFDGEYRARLLDGPQTFKWRVGYVHDNHKRAGLKYEFSTHGLYLDPVAAPSWLEVGSALRVFGGRDAYLEYMAKRETRNLLDSELRRDDPDF